MELHEFMARHRFEILDSCIHFLHASEVANEGIEAHVEAFFDEVFQALKREAGHPDSVSPLPERSDAAARLAEQPQREFAEPGKVPLIFRAISDAIGEVAGRYDLEIGSIEHKVLNQCMDAGVATCIERHWDRGMHQHRQQLSESFGHLAHELRTALGNAGLAFKLMRGGHVSMNGRTAGVLANNLARMETLVARTLGDTELEAAAPPTLRPLSVAAVLRQLQASFIPERAIALVLQVDEGLHVAADELLLSSAVSNLLSNALKFSRSGSKIVLRSYSEEAATLIEVEDECGGLKVDEPYGLLRPFARGIERPGSLGLGLPITLRATTMMGGQIRITDQPGRGCVFSLVFPHLAK